MPARLSFDCLWCGRPHRARDSSDIEAWAQLCPECVGRAGDNTFLRFRLKAALAERARSGAGVADTVPAVVGVQGSAASGPAGSSGASGLSGPAAAPGPAGSAGASGEAAAGSAGASSEAHASAAAGPAGASSEAAAGSAGPPDAVASAGEAPALWPDDAVMVAYYEARAPEYDDWYLRRGRYSRGAIHDMAWQLDLDTATRWLDDQPIRGEIVELAAGTGWWSPLLAQKGELWAYDAASAPLDRARERLLAHNLRAHLHIRDAWAEPDRPVDAVFAGFWLSHVPRERLPAFLGIVRRWLKPGGLFTFIDSRPDPQSGAADHERFSVNSDRQRRRLRDGREFEIVKVHFEPPDLERALAAAGFTGVDVTSTSRFFLLGRGVAG